MNCVRCKSVKNLRTVDRKRFDGKYIQEIVCQDCLDLRVRVEKNRGTMKYRLPISVELAEIIERGKASNSRIAAKYKNNVYSH